MATAELRINNAAKLSKEARKALAEWLRMHAKDLLKDGDDYVPKFRGLFNPAGR